ncbi:protein FAM131A isoform X2 [Denticeps clupeoides]|uniref:protein FAM131A isoform X2 n=1 Tax=Denticeps clupeoides TaxID=299321 RepID=UPI0010A3719C|nr:protein FAM131A-like isoform X2 [Denticeps clupeoides]
MGCVGSRSPVVTAEHTLRVDWSPSGSESDLVLLGNTRTYVAQVPTIPHTPHRIRSLDYHQWLVTRRRGTLGCAAFTHSAVNVDKADSMLPKPRRALTIQEIAALARSSLHGISQVVKDHVTKPTAMAQGRVAHLIEWKGWCKPIDSPNTVENHFNSYSHLTEGEQEARFAAGVAEQFAIAEAKLRAWSSIDGDDSTDDSYDEDFLPANEPSTQSTDLSSCPRYLRDLTHTHVCAASVPHHGHTSSPPSPADTLCSSLYSLDEHLPLLCNLGRHGTASTDLAAKILGVLEGGEELLLARLQRCGLRRGGEDSPCYSVTYSETYLSPGEEEDDCKDCCPPEYSGRRKVSDVVSSGVVSLDEEEEEEEVKEDRREQ